MIFAVAAAVVSAVFQSAYALVCAASFALYIFLTGFRDPFHKFLAALEAIHEEAHGAHVDPISGNHTVVIQHLMQGLEHEAVAAQHHDRIGLLQRNPIGRIGKLARSFLRTRSVRRE